MNIEVIRPEQLTAELNTLWMAWQRENSHYHSPFLSPDYVRAVGQVREDVRIAVIERDKQVVGFFPFQQRSRRAAVPVGGTLSDRQAVILSPDITIDARQLVQGCGLAAFDFSQFITSHASFLTQHCELHESVYIDISQGFSHYCSARSAAGSNVIKTIAYKQRRAAREYGPVRCDAQTHDQDVLRQLVTWKSQQYLRTGAVDVFAFGWTVELLQNLLSEPPATLRPVLSALYYADTLVAVQLSLQWQDVLHHWFPAYDPSHARLSPGMGLMYELLQRADSLGFRRVDLGKNNLPYKSSLGTDYFSVAKGSIATTPVARAWRSGVYGLRRCRSIGWMKRPYEIAGRYVRPVQGWIVMRQGGKRAATP